jgi:hypothetical protein
MRCAIIATVASIAAVAACEDSPPENGAEPPEQVLRAPGVTIVSLVNDPERYDGQTVRLEGEVESHVGRRLFVVRGRGVLWSAEIPVVARTRDVLGAIPPVDDDDVEVRGTANARLTPELAQELGREAADVIGDGPYVLAGSIRRQP